MKSSSKQLHEAYEDVVTVIAMVYVKTHRPQDPSVLDILTSIRGIPHVITVSQEGSLKKAPEGLQRLKVKLTFDDDHKYDIPDLEKAAVKIPGVKLFKVIEYEGKPYKDEKLTEGSFIRQFKAHARESDLVWHRDHQDRTITVLEGRGWQFQRDNELPQEMRPGQVIEVRAGEWHRVIKGDQKLKLKIRESGQHIGQISTASPQALTEAVKARVGSAEVTGQNLQPKHFIGGGSGNDILQRSLARKSELKPDESFFFLFDNTNAINAATGEMEFLSPQWVNIVSPDFTDLVSASDNPDYRVLSRSSKPNIVLISPITAGGEYYVAVGSIAHRLGSASKSTKKPVPDKILGYICEHALAVGIRQTGRNLNSLEEIELELRKDIRISPELDTLLPADLTDVLLFAQRSIEAVKSAGLTLVEAWVDGSQTAKYDVVGSSNGIDQDFNCHVKFNQGSGGSRFIGLQTGPENLNNPSTDMYRNIHKKLRDEWENRAIDPMPLSATRRAAAKDEKRETGVQPPTELQFPGFFETLMNELEIADYGKQVATDIKEALTPLDGNLSFAYFKQAGSKLESPIEVKIIQYAQINSAIEVVRSPNAIPSRAFEVFIGDIQPFHIEIRSLRQGQPPQLKTGRDYHKFEKLLNPKIYKGSA